MPLDQKILVDTEEFITETLDRLLPSEIIYHTVEHARDVAASAKMIGEESGLSDKELILAQLCGWLHDVGFTRTVDGHEEESFEIASEFLRKKGVDIQDIETIKRCILATKVPQQPTDLISKVVCDADLAHLASDDYYHYADRMRLEQNNLSGEKISREEFDRMSLEFFKNHSYHTEYGKTVLEEGKRRNEKLIRENLKSV